MKFDWNIMQSSFHEDLSSSSTSSFSSDDESDKKNLKPIKDYLHDGHELAKQLFMSVKAEKIKMMLPQVLKKINRTELQEWCASELSGMSRTRILSILNGKSMNHSSNTSESDDSGPSLEIISDTEEWITDSTDHKDNLSSKNNKKKVKKLKKRSPTKTKAKNVDLKKVKKEHVKKEQEPDNVQSNQGESLLDLLELEMRARAIRALIRKEEDVIPEINSKAATNLSMENIESTDGSRKDANKKLSAAYKVLNESEVFQGLNSSNLNEDEEGDVVLVIKPAPTIELLSSNSESEDPITNESNKSDNKVLGEIDVEMLKASNDDKKNDTSAAVDNEHSNKVSNEKCLSNKNCDDKKIVDADEVIDGSREKLEHKNAAADEKTIDKKSGEGFDDDLDVKIDHNKSKTPMSDRLNDYEEVIDLDDYSNDMDDMESEKETKSTNEAGKIDKDNDTMENCSRTLAETWVTRYYQTDNVQNVIKESKIQSEIRKRFRERQKLSKLCNTWKDSGEKSSLVAEKSAELDDNKHLGSVKEYLALKSLSSNLSASCENLTLSATSDNLNVNVTTSDDNDKFPSVCDKSHENNSEELSDAKLEKSDNEGLQNQLNLN